MKNKKHIIGIGIVLLFSVIGLGATFFTSASTTSNVFTIPDATGRLNQYNSEYMGNYPTDRISDIEIINGTFSIDARVPSYLHDGTKPNPGHMYAQVTFQGAIESYECTLQCQAQSRTNAYPDAPTESTSVLDLCMDMPRSAYGSLQNIAKIFLKPNSQAHMNKTNGKDGSPVTGQANIMANIFWFDGTCPVSWQQYANFNVGGSQWEESRQYVYSDINGVRTQANDPGDQTGNQGSGDVSTSGGGTTGQTKNTGGGGTTATRPDDQANAVPTPVASGIQNQKLETGPSPFFDGKAYDKGGILASAENSARLLGKNRAVTIAVMIIIASLLGALALHIRTRRMTHGKA